ncbi:glutathione S-transferase family protein [Piscinibacter koreensis]|uniref:Glutathione S-transferase family protein n=1 Tax=Piscinibacter koreensis TaxID=2742824 RepID=A0A7Y6NMD9_9BURK|nr:glutathione S-transferase family protein [Schlegelella koreensis]NUZ05786.1 glutathione S-transferase family protein [Schlegelella koreensis]
MITLYGFGRIFPEGRGETKDLRVQWALEETGLPYRVHALDHTAGELDTEAYGRLNPFRQAPVIDDHGFVLAESAAIVLYLAEKSSQLMPTDFEGRTRVVQWCCSAIATVEPILSCLDLIAMFDAERSGSRLESEARQIANRWLTGVERRLDGREWIACAGFTVADIMMAGVLRTIRKSDLLEPYPGIRAYHVRCQARPAWQRTLALTAERLGMTVDAIR